MLILWRPTIVIILALCISQVSLEFDKAIVHIVTETQGGRFLMERNLPQKHNKVEQNVAPAQEMLKSNNIVCKQMRDATALNILTWILLVLITLGTAGGNFLVILAVILVKKLQTPSNILIVSLAFSDFLVGILVLPFAILHVIRDSWPFNEALCDMYISFDVLLCTASILNLCAISIDRYLVITRPLTYIARRTHWRMAQMIAAAWIISALISIPPNFGWKPPYVPCQCDYSQDVGYQIYATFCAFYLPLIVMIVLYGKIFKLAREMSRNEQIQLKPSSVDEERCENRTSVNSKHDQYENHRVGVKAVEEGEMNTTQISDVQMRNPLNGKRHKTGDSLPNRTVVFHHSLSEDQPRKRSRGNSDTKVIKTLGVIMGCFCLCWLPFFFMQLLLALLKASGHETEDMVPETVFRLLQWLGYINSCLNPLIYAKFNREFRSPFKLILLCHCNHINARLRSQAFTTQYGLPSGGSDRQGCHTGTSTSSRVDRRSLLSGTRNSLLKSADQKDANQLT